MKQWVSEKRNPYVNRILNKKSDARVADSNLVCICGEGRTIWRCRDCTDKSAVCVLCCRNRHRMNPFHRVQKWNGRFYQSGALWQVGVKMYIGHNGAPCPKSISALSEVDLNPSAFHSSQSSKKIDLKDVAEKFGKTTNEILTIVSNILDRPLALSDFERNLLEDISKRTAETPYQLIQRLKSCVSKGAEQESDGIQANADRSAAEEEALIQDFQNIAIEVDGADEDWEDEDLDKRSANCPRFLPRPPPTDGVGNPFVTVVHSNGFHMLPFVWCNCPEHQNDRDLQLLDLHLYPASYDNIRTVFTFDCLDDHRYQYLECKVSHYQFHMKLRRQTCPEYPDASPNRYKELCRVARQWRNIKYRKWFWVLNDSSLKSGDMALFCAACPQPGINLPPDWKQDYDVNPYVSILSLEQ